MPGKEGYTSKDALTAAPGNSTRQCYQMFSVCELGLSLAVKLTDRDLLELGPTWSC